MHLCLSCYGMVSRFKIFPEFQKVHHIVILVLCVAVLTASLLFQPNESGLHIFRFKWPFRCFLYQTFGVKCALCGLTRSFCSAAHGNLVESLKLHPVGPLIFVFICLQLPYRIYGLSIRPKIMSRKLTKMNSALFAMLLIAIFVNWLFYIGGLIL